MDALMIALLVGLVAVAAVLTGWFVGSRSAAAAQAEAKDARERLTALEREHAVASEQAGRLRLTEETLKAATDERNRALQDVARLQPLAERAAVAEADLEKMRAEVRILAEAKAAFEQGQTERERAFTQQLAQVKELETKLETRFSELAGKAVETAHDSFLKRAGEKLDYERKEHQAKLQNLLQPVEATLKRYEEGLQRVEAERKDSYGELRGVLGELRRDNGQVRDEARRLVTALTSSPKQRGRWGERTLENLLLQAGLVKGVDFEMEVSSSSDEGIVRPDAIINLPEGRKLIIDSKCSLNAYVDYSNEVDDLKREVALRAHVASVRTHAQQLGSKDYWSRFAESAEMVILFIPGEHFLSAALEQDEKDCRNKQVEPLWDWAFRKKVLVTSPTSLLAVAKTIATMWKQDKLAKEAHNIAELGKELHSRISTMADHVMRLGKNLATANDAYNKMVGSLESQVLTQAKKFESYGSGSSKEIASPPMIEVAPRPLTKLAPPAANDEVTAAE